MHETRHYILLQRRNPAAYINMPIMTRLAMICGQLCAKNRHSEAHEVAQLRKRLSPPLYCGIWYSNRLPPEKAIILCYVATVVDKVEDFYEATGHCHAYIDLFQSRLLQPSTTAEELDQEALDLVSRYVDVDYPKGALSVLQLLLTLKLQRKLASVS
jgi:hypothetical protein